MICFAYLGCPSDEHVSSVQWIAHMHVSRNMMLCMLSEYMHGNHDVPNNLLHGCERNIEEKARHIQIKLDVKLD